MRAPSWPRRRLPLAWFQLRRQPVKVVVAMLGQTMAGTLIFLQLGLLQALFDASVLLHRQLHADLVMLGRDSPALVNMQTFSNRRLAQAYGHPAVEAVAELNIGAIPWRSPRTQAARSLLAVGLDPAQPAFLAPGLAQKLPPLKQLGRFLLDERARPEFAPMVERIRSGETVRLEVSGQRLTSAGLAEVGTSFGVDGFVLMSQDTFRQLKPQQPHCGIELGLIQLRSGANPQQVQQQLQALLPPDVEVFTHQGYIQREFAYWARNTVAAFVLGLGALIGFLAGIMVVYQIIYADVSDHLPEYATLMAMGYPLRQLGGTVVMEGLLLALLAIGPSLLGGELLYGVVRRVSLLPIAMTPARALFVFMALLVMAMVSALLCLGKLRDADPAEIF